MIGKNILICGYPHRTEYSDTLRVEEAACGVLYPDLELIRIWPIGTPMVQRRSMFEEVIHAIAAMHDMELDKRPELHHEIRTLATHLLTFLLDNPEWVDWFMEIENAENDETGA